MEILVALYYDIMKHDPANPAWAERDRFILSKGHAAPVLYSVLAMCGYTPEDQLNTLRKLATSSLEKGGSFVTSCTAKTHMSRIDCATR